MITPLQSGQDYVAGGAPAPSSAVSTGQATGTRVAAGAPQQGDTVSISPEAWQRTEAAQKPGLSWEKDMGLQAGASTLDNGNRQVVTIDGGDLSIKEYRGETLVKEVQGAITGSKVRLNTTMYGEDGGVSQRLHTELIAAEGPAGFTAAKMTRGITWYDGAEAVRTMHDKAYLTHALQPGHRSEPETGSQMHQALAAAINPVAAPMSDAASATDASARDGQAPPPATGADLAAGVRDLSKDLKASHYEAHIKEYDQGQLRRSVQLAQHSDEEAARNLVDGTPMSMPERTVGKLTLHTVDYDEHGDKVREVQFEDMVEESNLYSPREHTQHITASWFANGERIKKSHGSMTVEETESALAPDRPNMLAMLQRPESEYGHSAAATATELLAGTLEDSGQDATFFTTPVARSMSKDGYDAAAHIASHGAGDRPYDIQWTNEIYKDGELAARQRDTESAIENPASREMDFRIAGSLTEDARPATLRRSSHVDESYAHGRLQHRGAIEASEFLVEDRHGPDTIQTILHGQETHAGMTKRISQTLEATLPEADREAHKASTAMSAEVGLSIQDMLSMFSRMSPPR